MKKRMKEQEEIAAGSTRQDYGVDKMKSNGFYKCPRCKGMKTDFYLMQTRSADEPMTTFANCFDCGNSWKF